MTVRTLDFIDHERFLIVKNSQPILVLDFDIDAGFSFTNAVALKKMKKTKKSVTMDDSLDVPSKILNFKNFVVANVVLHSVEIEPHTYTSSEMTERYSLSAVFTPCKINYVSIEDNIAKRIKESDEVSEIRVKDICVAEYFQSFAEKLKSEILDFLELSSSFARIVSESYNLYLREDREYYRIVQKSGYQKRASEYPIHPLSLKSNAIQEQYHFLSDIPDNIKTYLKKGEHYNFLGFYDESFICYYKIIESTFKGKILPGILAKEIFNSDSNKLTTTIKQSNQKTMMLYVYQWLFLKAPQKNDFNKNDFISNFIKAGDLRNDISHSSDKSEESKALLPFIKSLAFALIHAMKQHAKQKKSGGE